MLWTRENYFVSLRNQTMNPQLSSHYPGRFADSNKKYWKKETVVVRFLFNVIAHAVMPVTGLYVK
jgi:hypothetical protein